MKCPMQYAWSVKRAILRLKKARTWGVVTRVQQEAMQKVLEIPNVQIVPLAAIKGILPQINVISALLALQLTNLDLPTSVAKCVNLDITKTSTDRPVVFHVQEAASCLRRGQKDANRVLKEAI